jgi:uncharacterized protein (TIGR02246 family)
MDAELARLVDEAAIRDLVRRYAHCVWQRDAAGAAALFAQDAVMDTGDRPALVGRAAILAEYTQAFAGAGFQPFLHNHVIDLDGDRATGTAYIELSAVVDGKPMRGRGYYDDEYVRGPDGWSFQRRRLNLVHYAQAGGTVEAAGTADPHD